MESNKYIMVEDKRVYKTPNIPNATDYYDINESKEDREERIYLYSEVVD